MWRWLTTPAAFAMVMICLAIAFDRELLAGADSGLSAGDTGQLEETVRAFNAILQDFYASGGDPSLIDEMPATKSVKHYLFRDIGYLQQAGLILVYDLASLTVIRSELRTRTQAEVVVYEEWNYIYQRAGDRQPVSPLRGTGLGARYSLALQDGAWVITTWNPEEVEPPQSLSGVLSQ
jgi:hypothetical protein